MSGYALRANPTYADAAALSIGKGTEFNSIPYVYSEEKSRTGPFGVPSEPVFKTTGLADLIRHADEYINNDHYKQGSFFICNVFFASPASLR